MKQLVLEVFETSKKKPEIKKAYNSVIVLGREKDEKSFCECVYCRDGTFCYDFSGEDIDIVEWCYLPKIEEDDINER